MRFGFCCLCVCLNIKRDRAICICRCICLCTYIYIHRHICIFPSGTSVWKWWNSWEIIQLFQVENDYSVVCRSECVRSLSLMSYFQLVAWEDGKSSVGTKACVYASSITCWGGSFCSLSLPLPTYQLVAEAVFPPLAWVVPQQQGRLGGNQQQGSFAPSGVWHWHGLTHLKGWLYFLVTSRLLCRGGCFWALGI